MDWKREALEKLWNYEAMKSALENIPAEIHRLELDYTSIRSSAGSNTPVQGGGARREDMLLTNIVRRGELARQLEIARAWVDLVNKALSCLDEDERMILDRIYVHPSRGKINSLMGEMGLEKSMVYRRRDRALRHFTLALYGGTEN